MSTLIEFVSGQKVRVAEPPAEVAAQLQPSSGPKRFTRAEAPRDGLWVNPDAVACFHELPDPLGPAPRPSG